MSKSKTVRVLVTETTFVYHRYNVEPRTVPQIVMTVTVGDNERKIVYTGCKEIDGTHATAKDRAYATITGLETLAELMNAILDIKFQENV